MRPLLAVLAAAALLVAFARPAAASCAPPAPVAENAGRAVAVVYGTVTSGDYSRATVRVDRVLKGSVGSTVTTYLGPMRGGGASSIDYTAGVGTDHVLYLVRGADGQLETNACIGSHPGAPTAEENAYFGAGSAPSGTSATAAPSPTGPAAPRVLPGTATDELSWVSPLLTLGSLVAVLLLARRRIFGR